MNTYNETRGDGNALQQNYGLPTPSRLAKRLHLKFGISLAHATAAVAANAASKEGRDD